jgi:hypothetical protein
MTCSEPATFSVSRRPRGPGGPRRVVTTLTPSTLPSPMISIGWQLKRNSTPSSLLFL